MDNFAPQTRDVEKVIGLLRRVLHADDYNQNCGLKADFQPFIRTWELLRAALILSVDVMRSPEPGHGLESLWLREVWRQAEVVEDFLNRRSRSFTGKTVFELESLEWLVSGAWKLAYKVNKFSTQDHSLRAILSPPPPPTQRLHSLADAWSLEFRSAPAEPQGPPYSAEYQAYLPWLHKQEDYIKQASDILIEAVVAVNIRANWFEDVKFRHLIFDNIEPPRYFIRQCLRFESGHGLLEFVAKLEIPTAGQESTAPREPYPDPDSYDRDEWIYQNMTSCPYRQLTVKLKSVADEKKWFAIRSRSAMKEAADRYAKYNDLPLRAFGSGRRRVA